jgi:hypothetical protein
MDEKGRSHNFSIDSDLADRGHIESLVEARYPAKKVYINYVGPDPVKQKREREAHIAKERSRREEQLEQLKSNSSSSSSHSSGNTSSRDYDDDDDDGEMSSGSLLGLLALAGGVWAFVAFTPLILMGVGGAVGTWVGSYATGQGVDDYIETKTPTKEQNKSALIVLSLALICGGFGFVGGTNMQNSWNASDTIEEVRTQ